LNLDVWWWRWRRRRRRRRRKYLWFYCSQVGKMEVMTIHACSRSLSFT
jgi:hypothetical protein